MSDDPETLPVADWPKRADGSNKTIGEMTPAEKAIVFKDQTARVLKQADGETKQ